MSWGTRLVVSVSVIAPWVAVVLECWAFLSWANGYADHSRSLDAQADLRHARNLLVLAVVGLAGAIGSSAWFVRRRSFPSCLMCGTQGLFGALFVVGDYASPIVHLPHGLTWFAAWVLATVFVMLAACTYSLVKRG